MTVQRSWCVMVMVCLLGSGCGAALPALPSKGGPTWLELKSANVTLWTDASPGRARELIDELEDRRQVVAGAMGGAQQRRRIMAVALSTERQAEEFIAKDVAAFAWNEANPSLTPGILMRSFELDDEVVLNHELAHAVSHSIIEHQPTWLAEGLASYFETGTLDRSSNTVQIGVPQRELVVYLRQSPRMPISQLFACEGPRCRTVEFYATSWLVFSYLLHEHYDRFSKYLSRLAELPRGEHLQAWREIFPDLTAAKLDRELLRINIASFKLPRIRVEVKKHPFSTRKLVDADVLALRSFLYQLAGDEAKARAANTAARAIDPTHLLAWLVAIPFDVEPSEREARAVATANRRDWRAWLLLRSVLTEGPDRDDANQRFCALAAQEGNDCKEWGAMD
jgi:hypothetical protein